MQHTTTSHHIITTLLTATRTMTHCLGLSYSLPRVTITRTMTRYPSKQANSCLWSDWLYDFNNPKFGNDIDDIYPAELEIKDTTDADHRASYLDLDLSYDRNKRLQVKLYDKRDDFDFNIVNFPFLSSNIPQSPAYGVYVSQLIRYACASSAYSDFLVRSRLLTGKLLGQGYNRFKLITTFKKFYGRHYDLIGKFQHSVTHMVTDLFLETLFLQ